MTIKSNTLFAKKYNKIFRWVMNHEYTEYTLTGGRGSCKSSFISLCIVTLIVMFPEFNALIIRKHANTLRTSVYEQIVWAIEKLGLKRFKIPESTTSALPIVYKRKNGAKQYIIFRGCDNTEKIKSIKIAKGYFGLIWFEEKTEFTPREIQNVKVSAMRGGSKFYVFESYNPSSATRHWCNTDARTHKKDRIVFHTTYLDIFREWLGEAILNEIEYTKENDERAYRNIFLGEATGTGRNVFENLEMRPITEEEKSTFDFIYSGVDFGYYPDPFAFVSMSYNAKERVLYIFDELFLLKHGNFEAFEKLKSHLKEQGLSIATQRITADSAEPKSIADFRKFGSDMRGAIKGRGSLEAGFKWLASLKKIVIDNQKCPKSCDEFSLYEYEIDKKTGEIMQGYPQGQPDHAMAAVRYALESVWRHAGE
ncbi:PBSX family phage terminase large subunit [Treponema pectinovorum]|uniref:PBSX family phage terminase large subunit n=1 Tax=Treponema pectinovorum TaxID=164 RepID=UPI0011CB8F9C|nr:PBSX family phage terminase large subunit [Treponema pectinovorum]